MNTPSTIELTKNIPASPDELLHLQECYLGVFISHLMKFLNITQYTCLDLMYSVNRLSSYASDSDALVFKVIKHML